MGEVVELGLYIAIGCLSFLALRHFMYKGKIVPPTTPTASFMEARLRLARSSSMTVEHY